MAIPTEQQVMAVLWPSFLTAGAATILFFVAFDPDVLLAAMGLSDADRLSVYSVAFLLFWLLTATTGLLTRYFLQPVKRAGDPDGPA